MTMVNDGGLCQAVSASLAWGWGGFIHFAEWLYYLLLFNLPHFGVRNSIFMVEDNYRQWKVKSNSKLRLGLNYIAIVFGVQSARYHLGCSTFCIKR